MIIYLVYSEIKITHFKIVYIIYGIFLMVEKIWFTSDWHLGHKNIIHLSNRPFKTIEQHDEFIVRRFNELVQPDDIVWILGDISFNQSYKKYADLFGRLNGKISVVLGNHDNRQHLLRCKQDGLIQDVRESKILNVGDKTIHLTHYPLREWHNFSKGGLHAYGHCHGGIPDYGKSTDVSLECWEYEPVEVQEFIQYVSESNDDI